MVVYRDKALFLIVFLSVVTLNMQSFAKPIKNKYGVTKNGKMSPQKLEELSHEVIVSQSNMTQEHYEDVVSDPQKARNDNEKLAGLAAREIFILVDRSGSMNAEDSDPTTANSNKHWTRWDSSRVAAESIAELALSLDVDNKVDVMLWDGDKYSRLQYKYETMTNVGQISKMFQENKPSRGSTPLAEALEQVYNFKLKALLQKSEPFTVIILTDGAPNNPMKVKKFFKQIIKDNRLEEKGKETLAAFSFVRIGDDFGAKNVQ